MWIPARRITIATFITTDVFDVGNRTPPWNYHLIVSTAFPIVRLGAVVVRPHHVGDIGYGRRPLNGALSRNDCYAVSAGARYEFEHGCKVVLRAASANYAAPCGAQAFAPSRLQLRRLRARPVPSIHQRPHGRTPRSSICTAQCGPRRRRKGLTGINSGPTKINSASQ